MDVEKTQRVPPSVFRHWDFFSPNSLPFNFFDDLRQNEWKISKRPPGARIRSNLEENTLTVTSFCYFRAFRYGADLGRFRPVILLYDSTFPKTSNSTSNDTSFALLLPLLKLLELLQVFVCCQAILCFCKTHPCIKVSLFLLNFIKLHPKVQAVSSRTGTKRKGVSSIVKLLDLRKAESYNQY